MFSKPVSLVITAIVIFATLTVIAHLIATNVLGLDYQNIMSSINQVFDFILNSVASFDWFIPYDTFRVVFFTILAIEVILLIVKIVKWFLSVFSKS